MHNLQNCLKLHLIAITNSKFKKATVLDMHYRIRYMHVKYQLNRDISFVKTVKTKKKLHKFTTCNSNFEKLILLDMHHPTPNICIEFEIVSYSATAFQSIFLRATDRHRE